MAEIAALPPEAQATIERAFGGPSEGPPESVRPAKQNARPEVSEPQPTIEQQLDARIADYLGEKFGRPEESPTREEVIDAKMERLFGDGPPKPPPQEAKPEPEPKRADAPSAEDFNANIFSWEEAQHVARFEAERQRFEGLVAQHHREAQAIEQIPDPQRKAAAQQWQAQREQALMQFGETLASTAHNVYETVKTRQETQLKRHRSTELQKLRSAFPTYDTERARSYLKSYGYDDATINSVRDHRELVIAEKARLWDEHQRLAKQPPRVARKVTKVASNPKKPPPPRTEKEAEDRIGRIMGMNGRVRIG